jgi:hypothetical protein
MVHNLIITNMETAVVVPGAVIIYSYMGLEMCNKKAGRLYNFRFSFEVFVAKGTVALVNRESPKDNVIRFTLVTF